jgi:hypothetical protein
MNCITEGNIVTFPINKLHLSMFYTAINILWHSFLSHYFVLARFIAALDLFFLNTAMTRAIEEEEENKITV